MFVLELYCFFNNPSDAGNLISGSSAFSKTSLNLWKFLVQVLLKPGLENFEHYFTSMWSEHNCAVVWGFFGTAFLKDWKEKKIIEERAEKTPQGRWDWLEPFLARPPLLLMPNFLPNTSGGGIKMRVHLGLKAHGGTSQEIWWLRLLLPVRGCSFNPWLGS